VFNDAKQRLVGMGSIFLVCYSKPVNPHDATLSRVARATFIFLLVLVCKHRDIWGQRRLQALRQFFVA
jgi:hypothetical protein